MTTDISEFVEFTEPKRKSKVENPLHTEDTMWYEKNAFGGSIKARQKCRNKLNGFPVWMK